MLQSKPSILAVLGLVSLVSLNALADAPAPTQLKCSTRATRMSLDQNNPIQYEEKEITVQLESIEDDSGFYRGQLVIPLANGYEIVVSSTVAKGLSTMFEGQDIMTTAQRLQKKNSRKKITVLASANSNSDWLVSRADLDLREQRPNELRGTHAFLENTEVLTAAVNAGRPMSAFQLLKEGLISEKTVTNASVHCHIR